MHHPCRCYLCKPPTLHPDTHATAEHVRQEHAGSMAGRIWLEHYDTSRARGLQPSIAVLGASADAIASALPRDDRAREVPAIGATLEQVASFVERGRRAQAELDTIGARDALASLYDDEPRELVDPTNRHFVATRAGRVLVQVFPRTLTPMQACELAAWLVCMAEIADVTSGTGIFDAEEFFDRALAAVKAT